MLVQGAWPSRPGVSARVLIATVTLLSCVLVSEAMVGAGECPLIIGVASTEGRPDVFKSYIGGQWRTSSSGKTLKVMSPVNETTLFEVQACTQDEIDEAFAAAKTAQKLWAKTPLWKRADLLKKTAATLREHAPHIAGIMMDEVAKPYAAALSEVMRTADLFEFTAEEGVRVAGELLLSDSFPGEKRNKLALVQRVPLGVVVAIPPYNYPLNLAGSKVGPALMAGNAIVMKPPSAGAVTGIIGIAAVMHLAGAPPGLVNVVTGKGSEIGDYLTQHRDASAVSFTGGGTGLRVAKGAGMIPLQMELGGKDPALVLPDCNIKKTAAALVKGAFSYSGQRCTAVKVVYVIEKDGEVSSQLMPLILQHVKQLKVGMPWEDQVDITAVIDSKSAAFIKGLVDDAVAKGAKVELPEGGWQQTGNLIQPVVLTGVNKDMRLLYEEQFGPVLPILSVASVEEAIEMSNASPLGLQASVFTQDIDAAMSISDALQAGTVQINGAPARGPDHFPFQGFKDSGLSSQGVRYSIEAMTKIKSTIINLADESYTQG